MSQRIPIKMSLKIIRGLLGEEKLREPESEQGRSISIDGEARAR